METSIKPLIKDQKQIKDYLYKLSLLSYIMQPEIGYLIFAQHQFSKRTQKEGYKSPALPISHTGFPPLNVLNTDLQSLYPFIEEHQNELNQRLEEILKGIKVSSIAPKDIKLPSPKIDYVEALIKHKNEGLYIENYQKLRLKETDGWLNLDKCVQDLRVKKTLSPILENKGEVLVLGASSLGVYLSPYVVTDMISIAPYLLQLYCKSRKYGEPNPKATYLLGDLIRHFKFRQNPDMLEQLFPAEKKDAIGRLKFFYPGIDEGIEKPTIIGVKDRSIEILKGRHSSDAAVIVNDENSISYIHLPWLIPNLAKRIDLYLKGAVNRSDFLKYLEEGYINHLCNSKIYKEISKLINFSNSTKEKIFYEIPQERKQNVISTLEELLGLSFEKLDIPKALCVDEFGTLYPHPNLWFLKGDATEERDKFRNEYLRLYRSEISPLEFLLENGSLLRDLPTLAENIQKISPKKEEAKDELSLNIKAFFSGDYFIFYHNGQSSLNTPFSKYNQLEYKQDCFLPFQKTFYDSFEKFEEEETNGLYEKSLKITTPYVNIITPYALSGRIAHLYKVGKEVSDMRKRIYDNPKPHNDKGSSIRKRYNAKVSDGMHEFGDSFMEIYSILSSVMKTPKPKLVF